MLRIAFRVVVLALTGVALATLLMNFGATLSSSELTVSLDSDEHSYITRLLAMLEAGSVEPRGRYNYGNGYFIAGYALSKVMALVGLRTDTFYGVGAAFRAISLLGYLTTLVLQYHLLRRLQASVELAAVLVLSMGLAGDMLWHATRVHPDTMQLAFEAAALCVTLGPARWQRTALAAALIGVAFGTKYSAAFALPIVVGVPTCLAFASERGLRQCIRAGVRTSMFSLVFACLGWLSVNVHVLANWSEFLFDFTYELRRTSRDAAAPLTDLVRWAVVSVDEMSVPAGLSILVGLAIALRSLTSSLWNGGAELRRMLCRPRTAYVAVVTLSAVLATAYYCLRVGDYSARYLWPVMMLLVTSAGAGLAQVERRYGGRPAWSVALFGLAIALAVHLPKGASASAKLRANLEDTEQWLVGRHVKKHFGAGCGEVRVLSDFGMYVPEGYSRIAFTRLSRKALETDPHGIVLKKRRIWAAPGTRLAQRHWEDPNAADASERAAFESLFSADSQYEIVYESSTAALLRRRGWTPTECSNPKNVRLGSSTQKSHSQDPR